MGLGLGINTARYYDSYKIGGVAVNHDGLQRKKELVCPIYHLERHRSEGHRRVHLRTEP